jgi:hypothetical protein
MSLTHPPPPVSYTAVPCAAVRSTTVSAVSYAAIHYAAGARAHATGAHSAVCNAATGAHTAICNAASAHTAVWYAPVSTAVPHAAIPCITISAVSYAAGLHAVFSSA